MFLNFISQVNMIIINTLPIAKGVFMRFMDTSGCPGTMSLLDYGLIDSDHINTVTSFVIDENARFSCGSDHALLECVLEFGSRPRLKWKFDEAIQYDINDNTNFTEYQAKLDQTASSITLNKFASLDTSDMLMHLSESINRSAEETFGLKIKRKIREICDIQT